MNVIEMTGEPILHGGQEKFIENIIHNMDVSGLKIDVLTPHICNNSSFKDIIQSKGGSVYELNIPFRPGKSRRLLLKPITDFLSKEHYDVAHIHSGSISVLAYEALASKRAGIKKIIVHSHSTGISSIKQKLIRIIFGNIIKVCATDYLACSRKAGEMKFPKSIVNSRLTVIQNGIPIKKYTRDNAIREAGRHKLGIGNETYVLGHVGRFSVEKNHEFLIDLFSEIHRRIPNSKLLLVGDGELIGNIKEKVNNLGLNDLVIFTGNVDNVCDYYQGMDVFILPSQYEGFSFATLEAEAAGLPCIISTGVPENVVVGTNVQRIDLEEKEKWIETCVLYTDKPVADNEKQIRAAGFDIIDVASQIKKIYENRGCNNAE